MNIARVLKIVEMKNNRRMLQKINFFSSEFDKNISMRKFTIY